MPQFACQTTEQVLNNIRAVTEKYGVTQQELMGVLFENGAALTDDQITQLEMLGQDRTASSKAVQRALKALEGLNDAQLSVILSARAKGAGSHEQGSAAA